MSTVAIEPLEVGDRVRYFTPRTCFYHGRNGVVVDRRPSVFGLEYVVRPDDSAEPLKYFAQNAVYGVEKWEPRRPVECGFECRWRQEGALS